MIDFIQIKIRKKSDTLSAKNSTKNLIWRNKSRTVFQELDGVFQFVDVDVHLSDYFPVPSTVTRRTWDPKIQQVTKLNVPEKRFCSWLNPAHDLQKPLRNQTLKHRLSENHTRFTSTEIKFSLFFFFRQKMAKRQKKGTKPNHVLNFK